MGMRSWPWILRHDSHIMKLTRARGCDTRPRPSSAVPHPLQYTKPSAPGRVSAANTSGSRCARLYGIYLTFFWAGMSWFRPNAPSRANSIAFEAGGWTHVRNLTQTVRHHKGDKSLLQEYSLCNARCTDTDHKRFETP